MHSLDQKYVVSITEFSNKADDPSKYSETLKNICTLTSIEELSYFLHYLKPFDKITQRYNLNIFKENVSASWEHEANIDGCSWVVPFNTRISNVLFERLITYFVLDGFKKFECNGIKVNVRKSVIKFEIWSKNVPASEELGEVFKEQQRAFGLDFPLSFMHKNHRVMLENVALSTKERVGAELEHK